MTPFWRRPIWILGHVIALTAVVTFVRLGLWQLDRLEEKKERNRVIAARSDGPPIDLLEVHIAEGEYQHVRATGRFLRDEQLTLPYQSHEGVVGSHAVAPLELEDGSVVVVNRGWFPDDAPPLDGAPAGEVTIEGLLREPRDRDAAQLDAIDALPLWLFQTAPPPDGDYPIRLPPPARDEGPHLSYAFQWFLFASVVGVGYPLLMRRRAHDHAREPAGDGGLTLDR